MMARTCHMCHATHASGSSDGYKETNLMRCSRCKHVYYCSAACQLRDWASHKLDCKRHQPQINTTADILAQAVYDDLFPEDPQTCEDYGFNRAVTTEAKSNLLSLYIGLIKIRGIPPKTVHEWRIHGVLADKIKATFCNDYDYTYFAWFLQNEHIVALAGKPLSDKEHSDQCDAMLVRSWRFTGGSEWDSVEDIMAAIARKPAEERQCHSLYILLLCNWSPSPDLDLWVDFGFASCTSEAEERVLGGHYRQLINMCTFKEFCDAYRSRRLLDLFLSPLHNIGQLRDLLCGSVNMKKSVWHLKQFVAQKRTSGEESASGLLPCVMVDYGFMNCGNEYERQQLKKVYEAFFYEHHGDPLALHEAAINGNLYGFLSSKVHGLSDSKFGRLMKNPYPLLNPADE